MTTKRHTIYDDLDPFDDPLDDVDGFDGFILEEDVDTVEEVWYNGDHAFCDFGVGDDDGLCIKERYGCNIEGCPYASPNE